MTHDIDVMFGCEAEDLPAESEFMAWAGAALAAQESCALSIRVIDEAEGRSLNHDYRNRDTATNVLSFPLDLPDDIVGQLEHRPLGDLAICAPVVAREAAEQGKLAAHHWAHLIVHGVLHLLGYDHETATEADVMERLEREILAGLGIPDPYL